MQNDFFFLHPTESFNIRDYFRLVLKYRCLFCSTNFHVGFFSDDMVKMMNFIFVSEWMKCKNAKKKKKENEISICFSLGNSYSLIVVVVVRISITSRRFNSTTTKKEEWSDIVMWVVFLFF